jgi:aminoglycoside 6'-N-acetyltransferase I
MADRVRRPMPIVRRAEPADANAWLAMREALWPGDHEEHRRDVARYFGSPPASSACLVAIATGGATVGFVEVGLRPHAVGCRTSPVGFVEGIFVVETQRGCGVGRALMDAAEAWARGLGCTEMGSDAVIDNEGSARFHGAMGYAEVERVVCFRKSL